MESKQLMCITKIKIRVQSGDQGAKAGLVLMSEQDPASLEEDKLKAFDSWTAEDFENAKTKRCVALG